MDKKVNKQKGINTVCQIQIDRQKYRLAYYLAIAQNWCGRFITQSTKMAKSGQI